MSANLSSQEIIASALQLPLADRELILEALQQSLIDVTIDHGAEQPAREVESAWSEEIAPPHCGYRLWPSQDRPS